MKKLTSVTIGKNVKTIGREAFENCSGLREIRIRTRTLKNVGDCAFSNVHRKVKVLCPKGKAKKYRKILTAAGLPETASVEEE